MQVFELLKIIEKIVHDLRTPLTVFSLGIQVLRDQLAELEPSCFGLEPSKNAKNLGSNHPSQERQRRLVLIRTALQNMEQELSFINHYCNKLSAPNGNLGSSGE